MEATRRKLKIEKDGNDSLSVEHKEEIHIFQKSMDLLTSRILNNNEPAQFRKFLNLLLVLKFDPRRQNADMSRAMNIQQWSLRKQITSLSRSGVTAGQLIGILKWSRSLERNPLVSHLQPDTGCCYLKRNA